MTGRAIFIGILAVVLIAIATPYSDLVMQGTWVGLTAFPISAFFLLLLLAAVINVVPRKFGIGLSRAELLVIYCMMLVAAGIPSFGLTGLLIPYIVGPFYFASAENKWAETLWPNLPEWLHPEPGIATRGLYEGLQAGTPIPWGQWAVPLAAWSILAISVYTVFFATSALLRRRWVDDEKLVFPLVQLPVEMSEYDEPTDLIPSLFSNRIMWAMFFIPFAIHALNGLHHYYPVVPSVNVHRVSLSAYLDQRPWSAMSPLWLRFLFSIVGLAYLLPSQLSFSLWFFLFFFLIQQVIGSAAGYPMPTVQAYPVRRFVAHQMIGGVLAYFFLSMTAARTWLRQIWAAAMGRGAHDDRRRREAMPYFWAFWAAIAGLAAICLWGAAAGATFSKTLIIFILFLILHIIAVRLVCEGGMLYVQHPYRPMNMMIAAVGTSGLGARPITILALFDHLFMLDNRSPLMPGIMQSLRIADDAKISRRGLMGALAASVIVAMAASYFAYLRLMYVHGGTALNTWFTTYYTQNLYCTWTNHLIVEGEPARPEVFVVIAIGAMTMWGLAHMHWSYVWWPLHPIGYMMGASWPMLNYWFPVMLGWVVKTTVLRLGGHKMYQRLLPGFLGLIFGEFASAGLWVLIDFVAGVRGHQIFSF